MGAKTWMLVGTSASVRDTLAVNATLDRDASVRLAQRLFPREKFEPLDDGDLSYTCPPDDEVHIGCFPGVTVAAAKEFGIDYPSTLELRFLNAMDARTVYLHAMHSVVDWFAFAVWRDGRLERSLSLSPDSGIMEDIGSHLPFEVPYWLGEFPAVDPNEEEEPYPFPFHPLDLGEAALTEFFGYQLEGSSAQPVSPELLLEPESIPLLRLKRKRSLFRIW